MSNFKEASARLKSNLLSNHLDFRGVNSRIILRVLPQEELEAILSTDETASQNQIILSCSHHLFLSSLMANLLDEPFVTSFKEVISAARILAGKLWSKFPKNLLGSLPNLLNDDTLTLIKDADNPEVTARVLLMLHEKLGETQYKVEPQYLAEMVAHSNPSVAVAVYRWLVLEECLSIESFRDALNDKEPLLLAIALSCLEKRGLDNLPMRNSVKTQPQIRELVLSLFKHESTTNVEDDLLCIENIVKVLQSCESLTQLEQVTATLSLLKQNQLRTQDNLNRLLLNIKWLDNILGILQSFGIRRPDDRRMLKPAPITQAVFDGVVANHQTYLQSLVIAQQHYERCRGEILEPTSPQCNEECKEEISAFILTGRAMLKSERSLSIPLSAENRVTSSPSLASPSSPSLFSGIEKSNIPRNQSNSTCSWVLADEETKKEDDEIQLLP